MDAELLVPFGLKIIMPPHRKNALPSLSSILQLVHQHKVVLIRNADPMTREALIHYCKDGKPDTDPFLHWDFGPVMDLEPSEDAKNYLFSREAVPFHWDGAFHKTPSYLVFNCIEPPAPGSGGETIFCDTERVYLHTPEKVRRVLSKISLTYRTEKKAHYGGEFTTRLVDKHPHRGNPILRFAEEVKTKLNPVTMEVAGVEPREAFEMIDYLTTRIYQSAFCLEHHWKRGDLLLADNHGLIHGRRAFQKQSPRHIRRVQLL